MKQNNLAGLGSLVLVILFSASTAFPQVSPQPSLSVAASALDGSLLISLSVPVSSSEYGITFNRLMLGQGTIEISRETTIVFSLPSGPVAAPRTENGKLTYTVVLKLGPESFIPLPGQYKISARLGEWRSGSNTFTLQ